MKQKIKTINNKTTNPGVSQAEILVYGGFV